MNKSNSKKSFKKIAISLSLFCAIIFGINTIISQIPTQTLQQLIQDLGIIGPIIIILYTIVSHILAPLTASPVFLISLAVYGTIPTTIFIYLGSMISAAINFWIARKYGRTLVQKLVGAKTIKEIDQFVEIAGTKILIVSRLIGFSLYEIISYAFGLTQISFKRYFLITALISLVPDLLFIIFAKDINFKSTTNILIAFTILFAIAALFSLYIKKSYEKYSAHNNDQQ